MTTPEQERKVNQLESLGRQVRRSVNKKAVTDTIFTLSKELLSENSDLAPDDRKEARIVRPK